MVLELESGKVRPATESPPLLTSAARKWPGVLFEQHRLKEVDVRHVCCLNHVVLVQLETAPSFEWGGDLPKRSGSFQAGQVALLPAYAPISARTSNAGEFMTLSLDTAFLACAASEYGALEKLELRAVVAEEDPLVRELLGSFKAELSAGDALYVQSLATMLAVHLVRKYSTTDRPRTEIKGGLSREQLINTTDYIQSRLGTPISLAELAGLNQLSLFHFTRLFKRSTGITPYDYVTRARIEKARTLLLRSEESLTDIALRVGFYDQSHFSRHFKRVYGTTPAAFLRRYRPRKIVV